MNRGDGKQTIDDECIDAAAEQLALALIIWRKDGKTTEIDYNVLHSMVMGKARTLVEEHNVPLKAPL